MTITEKTSRIKHLYSRAGFGLNYSEIQELSRFGVDDLVSKMVTKAKTDKPLEVVRPNEIAALLKKEAEIPKERKDYTPEKLKEKRMILKNLKRKHANLNIKWVSRMINENDPFREKMTLFWSGHFACREITNPFFAQELNNIQRKYALGDFKTLLVNVSKSAAMLDFLNNQQNEKTSPNENFARELMELFTLGRGNYTEDDIKNSARAFTGWKHDKYGNFVFRKNIHDEGQKIFFGKTGNFDGEDIIDMILEKPQVAGFLAGKMYRFFVSDTPNETHIKELGDHFYKSKYDIAALIQKIFTSEWFYSPENTGNKIKSPVEFIVGFSRRFSVRYSNPDFLMKLQNGLGQTLFYPPNVSGWAGGRSWIDGSSLLLRMKVAAQTLENNPVNFNAKVDPDDENLVAVEEEAKRKSKVVVDKGKSGTFVDWNKFFNDFPENYSTDDFASFLLECPASTQLREQLKGNSDRRKSVIRIVSSPEYQLC